MIGHSWAYHRWSRGTYELCLVFFKVLGGRWYLCREGILRFESQFIYMIYIIYTHTPWITALLIRHLASTVNPDVAPHLFVASDPGGDFHLLEISYLNFGQKYPKMMKNSCFILPTCNRKVVISYLQNCGVFARSVTCGGAVGKLRLLYLSTSGFLQDQLIWWIFFGVTPPKNLTWFTWKWTRMEKISFRLWKPSFSGSMWVFEGVIMLQYILYIYMHTYLLHS